MSERSNLLTLKRKTEKSSSPTPPKVITLIKSKTSKNEEEKAIEEISEEIYKKNKKIIAPASGALDFSNMMFQLSKLDTIFKIPKMKPEKIFSIDFSNNQIKSIEILNAFPYLKTINAASNLLQEVNLKLNYLEDLNLSFNKLDAIPNLQELPKLKNINLAGNFIKSVDLEFMCAKKRLYSIDISRNQIAFGSGNELQKFIDHMKTMDSLKILNVEHNPFFTDFQRTKDHFLTNLGNKLEKLNWVLCEKDYQELKDKNESLPALKLVQDDLANKEEGDQNADKENSLDQLNTLIEQCSSNPIKCMIHITKLAKIVNSILNDRSSWEYIFLSKDAEDQMELNDQMDSFLQNSLILIENQQNIQGTLTNIIANLSVIPLANFGDKCLRTLNDLIGSGEKMKELVMEVLEKSIASWLCANVNSISRSILNGLVLITTEKEISEVFKDSIKNMSEWIKQILKFTKNNPMPDREILALHDNALELIAAASGQETNAQTLRNCHIEAEICQLFKISKDTYFSNRYISILKIIEKTSRADKETSLNYLKTREAKDSLLKDIQNEILNFIQEFKKNNNDLRDEVAKDTDSIIKLKFNKFASLINALSAINLHEVYKFEDLKANIIISELLIISTLNKVNPVLLSSLCDFIYDLLNNKSILASEEQTKYVAFEMQKLNPLMPYMGGKKYNSICEMGEMYQTNTFFGKEAVARNHLSNKVIHQTFIAIIRLITFFTEKAYIDNTGQNIWTQVSKSLNTNRREAFLFNCLDVPSDEVKLRVVRCLLVIKNEEWDTDEIGHLVTMLGSYKNLGAGDTEEVLSSIFIILSKLAMETNCKVGKEFASLFAENAITNCFDILARNMERNVKESEEENKQKLDLSIACIYFLKVVSNITSLRGILRGNQVLNAMRRSLIAEQKTNFETLIPVEIECTWSGRFLENLLLCTTGNDALPAYHMVSYRIISRIADVLQAKVKEGILDLGVCYDKNNLRKKTQEEFTEKIKKEFSIWEDDVTDESLNRMIKNMDEREQETFFKQHNYFSSQNGLERILMFLLGKTASTQAALLEKQLVKEFDPKFSENKVKDEIEKKVEEFVEEEINMINEEEKNKKVMKTQQRDSFAKKTKSILENAFKELHSAASNFDERTMDKFILTPPITLLYTKNKEITKKQMNSLTKMKGYDVDFIETDENVDIHPKIKKNKRALLVSAMLRCMYAAIEYAPDENSRRNSINQIKQKKIIKMLTQLCDCTGWTLGNLGSKYLKIIYYGLRLSDRELNESKENFEIYDLVSKAICDMLQIIRKKIFQEDKIPLSKEDKMLIYDLAKTTSVLISQVPNIHWVENKIHAVEKHGSLYKTPQERCVELSLIKIFPKNILKTFIDMVLNEMKHSQDLSSEPVKDLKEMKIRDTIRLYILNIIGTYMSKCKDQKYEMLEHFTKAQIFDKKVIRQSFVQEILKEMTRSNYLTRLIKFVLNLEGSQRLAFQSLKPFGKSFLSSGSRCCVVFFPKLHSKNSVLQVLHKFDAIHKNIDNDELTIKALEKLTQNNVLCVWAVFNPPHKILVSEADVSIYDFENYRLFVISDEKLYILKEKSNEWFFFFQREGIIKSQFFNEENESSDEDAEDVDISEKKKQNKEDEMREAEAQMIFQKEAAKKAQNVIFNENEVFDLKNVKSISFDQGPIPFITLKAGTTMNIEFGCDFGRESFRMALLRTINPETGWKKKHERPGEKKN